MKTVTLAGRIGNVAPIIVDLIGQFHLFRIIGLKKRFRSNQWHMRPNETDCEKEWFLIFGSFL